MTHLAIQEIGKKFIKKKVPVLRPGYNVRIHQKIKEGEKERIQVFEGMVVQLNAGHGPSKTFTVRKVVQGIAVEKVFPLYSPLIEKIEIKKTFGVRRAKLNYLRAKDGISKRLSAKLGLTDKDEAHKQKKGWNEEEAEPVEAKAEEQSEAPAEAPAKDEKAAEEPKAEAKAEPPAKEDKPEAKKEDEKAAKPEETKSTEETQPKESKPEAKPEEAKKEEPAEAPKEEPKAEKKE